MSTYYKEKIKYITDDLTLENFDLYSALNKLKSLLQDRKHAFYWKKLYELKVRFEIHTPDYGLLHQFYEQGVFKSHEFTAIVDQIKDSIKGAITNKANYLDYTINQYIRFKHSVSINRYETFKKILGNNSTRIDIIELKFNLTRLDTTDVFAFLKWWNLDVLAFSKQISIHTEGKMDEDSNFELISEFDLEKKPLQDIGNFISCNDLEITEQFLGHSTYFKMLKNYIFPEGFENHAEITLDIAQDEIVPQKRRTVSIDGMKMKFHQIISEMIPFTEYRRIIHENKISGIYCSVKSTRDDLLYLLIDIDVPPFFYNLFPAQIVWDLTIEIANSINTTASQFGLPSFKISFSGAKGVHLILTLENPKVIQDVEQYVNFSELYGFSTLPGMKTLKKEKVSSLNDTFKFAKSLLQSLLLYTVYKGDIEIPEEIKYKLRISHPYQIFRLSPDSKNRIAILLDCSSMSRGVFRLCSPHPASKLVSIPISDMKTSRICDKYYDYNNIREDAKLENVIEKFNNNDIELFLQKPYAISRKHIKELLRPDKLLPTFATLLRFGTIYSIMRSPMSFQFWSRFFELRSFYNYVQYQVEHFDGKEPEKFINYIGNMASRLQIENKHDIIGLIKLHMNLEEISFPLFKHWLSTLYYIEFFFNLKSDMFLKDHESSLIELFQNEMFFNNFLNQAQELFNIAVHTLTSHLILEDDPHLSQQQIESLNAFYTRSCSLIDLARYYLSDLKHDTTSDGKEKRLVRTIHLVSRLYFNSVEFIGEFFNLIGKSKGA